MTNKPNGKVYVFSRLKNWSQPVTILPPSAPPGVPFTGYSFGSNIATSNDGKTALIGATRDNIAFLYRLSNNGWIPDPPMLRNNSDIANDITLFAWSVALSGDGNTALLGAINNFNTNPGIVYEFGYP